MSARASAFRWSACLGLFVLDRGLAHAAVELRAASVFLSPLGSFDFVSLAAGLSFLAVRILFAVAVCATLAWTVSDLVGQTLTGEGS